MSVPKSERTTLKNWIEEMGAEQIAKLLKTDPSAVSHWKRGFCLPSSKQMAAILKYSKGAVDFNVEIASFYKKSA